MMLPYLTPTTLEAIYADLKEQLDTLRLDWEHNHSKETFYQWDNVGKYIGEVKAQYEALTGEEIQVNDLEGLTIAIHNEYVN